MNWKSLIVDTGASISALDYVTSLVSRWAFGGNLNDSQGSNNGTGAGSPGYVNGVYGQAISLNGFTQYVTVADSASLHLSAFSISGWIYPTAVGTLQVVLTKGGPGQFSNYSVVLLASGQIQLVIGNNTSALTLNSITALTSNKWYHFLCTFDGTSVWKIYINGVPDSSQTSAITPYQTTAPLYIGANAGVNYFAGYLDQLQIFSADVSSAAKQIYSDCHAGQLAYCEYTGSQFTAGILYRRNAENTGWEQVVDLTSTQTLTNKTINDDQNTIADSVTNAAGDLLKNNGTKYVRFGRGSANQVLQVNSAGTDITYGVITAANLQSALTVMGTASFSTFSTTSTTDVDVTGATVTITASGNRAGLISECGSLPAVINNNSYLATMKLTDSSNTQKGYSVYFEQSSTSGFNVGLGIIFVSESAPPAGSLTRKLRVNIANASQTLQVQAAQLVVMEVL